MRNTYRNLCCETPVGTVISPHGFHIHPKTMKKQLLLSFLLFLFAAVGYGQTVSSHSHIITVLPFTPCVGAPVTFTAIDTTGNLGNADHYWYFGDGGNGYGSALMPSVTHFYSSPGTYYVTFYAFDSLAGFNDIDTIIVTVDSICGNHDNFSGTTYFDTNSNGNQDVGEPNFPNRVIEIMPGPYYLTSDANGNYGVNLPAGNYTFTTLPPTYYAVTEPTIGSYSVISTGSGSSTSGLDFGIMSLPGMNDLRVTHYSIPPVPGFNRMVYVDYENVGTSVISNVTVTLQIDPGYNFVSAANGGTFSGNMITWSFPWLAPNTSGTVSAMIYVPVSTVVGSPLSNISRINPIPGDQTPGNNTYAYEQIVLSSYDPNDKSVQPKGLNASGDIAPGTPLLYTIRFQNTGTFYANDVILRDTLDGDLDQSTLEVIAGSHPFTWHNDFGKLAFDFHNIMLPDSNTNEPASHGFVRFRIAPKAGLALGTELTNTGHIYFDFNAPIVTNTTLNTLANLVSIAPSRDLVGLTVAPNPFANYTQFEFENLAHEHYKLTLRDLSGRLVMAEKNIEGNRFQLDASHLPAGMYLYTLQGASGNVASGKLIKQ
jgi:PKD domain/Secretion system C-terminal sorting domain/Domain of unknown function DUF11